MPIPFSELKAPYPNPKDTTLLPKPRFQDIRASENRVHVKRTMKGVKWTYVDSSERTTLTLPFILTRMKAIELERFLDVYKAAPIFIELYDGTTWNGILVGQPVTRTSLNRTGEATLTGSESVEVTLVFSAEQLS